jgi:CBS domain-containing protein
MIEHDYSQLPVIDSQGYLLGLISDQSINRVLYHLKEKASVLELPVGHCIDRATTLPRDADVFEALDYLQTSYALVVTEERKPVGIITHYDTTRFLRNLSGDQLVIQDIEVTLRRFIESVFSNDHQMTAALHRAFGADHKEPTRPRNSYDQLSFGQHVQVIVTDENWIHFEPILRPKYFFDNMMRQVGDIRNQLAHFRGTTDPVAQDVLKRARSWLETRPRPKAPEPTVPISEPPDDAQRDTPTITRGKYAPLERWLRGQSHQTEVNVKFSDIEDLLSQALPPSAYEHQAWWANDTSSRSRHSLSWLYAGWKVADVDLNATTAQFVPSLEPLSQIFLAETTERLSEMRPDLYLRSQLSSPHYAYMYDLDLRRAYGWLLSEKGELRISCAVLIGALAEWSVSDSPPDLDHLVPSPSDWQPFGADVSHTLRENQHAIEHALGHQVSWRLSDDHPLADDFTFAELIGPGMAMVIKIDRVEELLISHKVPISRSATDYQRLLKWAVNTMITLMENVEPLLGEWDYYA